MFKLLTFSCLIAFTGFLWSGCYPGGADFTEDLDVVYTNHSPQYDFQSKGTYAMPDKIVVDVEIENGDTTVQYMKDIYAGPILQRIDDNMASLGWTKVDISTGPDVLLTPAGISSTTYYYDYWYDWWYGGWYGGWGWYYPPYVTVSSFTTGTLLMTIEDPNVESAIDRSEAVWVAGANGVLTGYYSVDRVLKGIDQAFKQSPYLKTN
jgi:hypothetical protein